MNLKDKVVVITGSSKGLGKEMARLFIAQGAKVVINSRSEDELNKAAQELGAFPIVGDVTKEEDVINLAKKAVEKFERIDIWVNNAGLWVARKPIEEYSIERTRQMLEVNLFGVIFGCRAVLPVMRKQGEGVILTINSTSGLVGREYSSGYVASKFAVDGYIKTLRAELNAEKALGIKVLSIHPGGMKTDLFEDGRPDDYDTFMEPAYVAGLIVENLEKDSPDETLVIRRSGT